MGSEQQADLFFRHLQNLKNLFAFLIEKHSILNFRNDNHFEYLRDSAPIFAAEKMQLKYEFYMLDNLIICLGFEQNYWLRFSGS